MKDSLEYLIRGYEAKVRFLKVLHDQATDDESKVRLLAKKSTYQGVVIDLKRLLKDEEDKP